MKETLGLFLETNCFLEIALPTVLHLIINPNDHMQFVDHVRVQLASVACYSLSFSVYSGGFTNPRLIPNLSVSNGKWDTKWIHFTRAFTPDVTSKS